MTANSANRMNCSPLIEEITGQFYRGKVAAIFQGPTLDGKFGNILFV